MNNHLSRAFLALACVPLVLSFWLFAPPPERASAQFVDQSTYGGTSGGSANAQTITIGNYAAHTPGVMLRFIPVSTNTGPMTINVSGLGAVVILRSSSIGDVALSGGELLVGELTCVMYNGSVYKQMCNQDLTPIGRTVEYRGAALPRGTLIEDGSTISRATYAGLFTVIGTTYGAGDGSTTFNLPNSNGTVFAALDNQGVTTANKITLAGSGCNGTVIGACGSQNQTLSRDKLPNTSVAVSITDPGHAHTYTYPTNAGNTGGGGAFGNLPGTTVTSSNSTGISAAFNLNGSVTQTATTTLDPILLGRRAIKY